MISGLQSFKSAVSQVFLNLHLFGDFFSSTGKFGTFQSLTHLLAALKEEMTCLLFTYRMTKADAIFCNKI